MDLSRTPIRTMEPLLVERLRLAFPAKDFQIQRIPSVLTIEEFTRVVKLTPFIGLAWLGVTVDRNSGRQLDAAMRWRLTLIVKASSRLEARFSGDRRDIGLDAMVDVATALMQGWTLDKVGACWVTSAEAVYAEGWGDMATVVAQVDFEVRYQASAAPLKLVTPEDFEALDIEWLADGGAEEGGPDASQTIEPPQEDAT